MIGEPDLFTGSFALLRRYGHTELRAYVPAGVRPHGRSISFVSARRVSTGPRKSVAAEGRSPVTTDLRKFASRHAAEIFMTQRHPIRSAEARIDVTAYLRIGSPDWRSLSRNSSSADPPGRSESEGRRVRWLSFVVSVCRSIRIDPRRDGIAVFVG